MRGGKSSVNGAQQRGLLQPFPLTLFSRQIYNLGTGTGYSVLQMVQAMEKASGKKVSPSCSPTQWRAHHFSLPCPSALVSAGDTALSLCFLRIWPAVGR